MKVNDQYRIEFIEETEDGKQIATICSITAPLLAMQNEYDMLMAERNESFMEKIRLVYLS